MEASALPRSATLPRPRLVVAAPLLRLRSDDQLVALFRAGSDDAFRAIHDRYRVRLLAYARQMLGGSTADAEDALQEVFVRAHAALLASSAPISLRAWLYRIAHNRCIDQLRRPSPIPSEITPGAEPALSPGHRHDPPAAVERSEDFRRLVSDVHALPEQQRSALLMRELQGLSYEELAVALGISVAAVKSVLLRARGGVLDAAEARNAPCAEIRLELVSAHDRGVRASGRARRHMRECDRCCSYRGELRAVRREVAGLVPVGPLGHLGLLFGIGGGGAGGGLAAGGTSAVLGGAASVTATKVAALVCCAALLGTSGALRSGGGGSHHRTTAHAAKALPRAPATPARVVARVAGGTIAPPVARAELAAPRAAGPASHPGPAEPPLTGQDSYATGDGTNGTLGLTAASVGPATAQAEAPAAGGVSAPDATLTTPADPTDAAGATPATTGTSAAATTAGDATQPGLSTTSVAATPAPATATGTTAPSATVTPAPVARLTAFHSVVRHRSVRRRISWSAARGTGFATRGDTVEPQPVVATPSQP